MFKEKIKRAINNNTLRNGMLFSIYSFINKGFSFLLLIILANYLTPAEYGYLSLFSTVVMVVGYFKAFSTEGYLTVSYFKEGKKGVRNTFSGICFLSIAVSTILLLIIGIFGDFVSSILQLPIETLILAVIISFFTLYTNCNLDLFRLKENVKIYGIFTCTNALINFALSIILIKYLMYGWIGRVYSQFISFAIFGIIGFIYFIKEGYLSKPNWRYLKNMLIWGIPLIPHMAVNFLRQGCDRYIINYYHSIDDVGLFSFALNLSNIIFMIGMGFNQSNSVDIYKLLGSTDVSNPQKIESLKKQRKQITIIYTVLSVLALLACLIFIPILVSKYTEALKYLPILAIYAYLYCIYLLYVNYLYFYKETKKIMYITVGSSIVHLTASLFLTRYSLYCTSMIYLATQLAIVLLIRRLAIKELTKHLK